MTKPRKKLASRPANPTAKARSLLIMAKKLRAQALELKAVAKTLKAEAKALKKAAKGLGVEAEIRIPTTAKVGPKVDPRRRSPATRPVRTPKARSERQRKPKLSEPAPVPSPSAAITAVPVEGAPAQA